jgi:hypothetical protein
MNQPPAIPAGISGRTVARRYTPDISGETSSRTWKYRGRKKLSQAFQNSALRINNL